jgi:deferrochelatase/peroxidase EfeB
VWHTRRLAGRLQHGGDPVRNAKGSVLRQAPGGYRHPPQTAATFLSYDVTATSRRQLIDLFRTLTGRAAFLTAGGTAPPTPLNQPPSDNRLLGPTVLPDDLTVTVALGASLFDGRYGLGPRKPTQLETMRPFTHDNLDPKISDGDLLVQLCASHRDTVGHTMLDLLAHTSGGMRLRWRIDGFRFPPRPVGIPRDWMGFKDGITNPDPTDTAQMNQQVWVQPGPPEPAWTADAPTRCYASSACTWTGATGIPSRSRNASSAGARSVARRCTRHPQPPRTSSTRLHQ